MSSGRRYSIIPSEAVSDRELAHLQIRVLCALGAHADSKGFCVVKQRTLANEIRSQPGSVRNALRRLIARGYVRREQRYFGNGSQISNRYQVVIRTAPASSGSVCLPADDVTVGSTTREADQESSGSASAGGVHLPLQGGRFPRYAHKNDPSSKRLSSVEDDASARPRNVVEAARMMSHDVV